MADWRRDEETVGELISRARLGWGKSQYALADALREAFRRSDGAPDRGVVAWDLLEREGAVEPAVHGYIPAFEGADTAADRLASLPVWQRAEVVKSVPDRAQQPVRERALLDGKLLYMAVPMLAGELPFYVLDPRRITVGRRGSIRTTARWPKVAVEEMQPGDIVVSGSVAVNLAARGWAKARATRTSRLPCSRKPGWSAPQRSSDDGAPDTSRRRATAGNRARVQRRPDRHPDEVIECGPPQRPRGLTGTT